MTITLIVILCILALGVYLLSIPIVIIIDTDKRCLSLTFVHFVQLTLITTGVARPLRRELRVFSKVIKQKQPAQKAVKVNRSNKKKRTSRKRSWLLQKARAAIPDLLQDLFRAIDVHSFRAALDSRDFVLNAQLFALQPILIRLGLAVEINFVARNFLLAKLTVSPPRVLGAGLRFIWNVYVNKPIKRRTQNYEIRI